MTAISDFVADPIAFLRANVLQSFWTGSPVKPVRSLRFHQAALQGTRLDDGANIPAYQIIPISDQGDLIRLRGDQGARNRDYLNAYFCPYGDNQTCAITVASAADFMFTTNMDGCTFGIGSDTPTGARRVAHANVQGMGQGNRAVQLDNLALEGTNDTIVNPDRYRDSRRARGAAGISATTIGIRDTNTGKWRFVYQQWQAPFAGGNPVLFTVKRA